MKQITFLAMCLCCRLAVGTPAALSDAESDVTAIKNVIIAETSSWASKDYAAWQETWVQDPEALAVYISKYNHREIRSWKAIAASMKEQMAENPEPFLAEIVRENFSIRVDGTLAWAAYEEVYITGGENDRERWHSRQLRTLVKQDGQWKILSLTGVEDYGYNPDFAEIEWDMNMTGRRLLAMGKIPEAIEFFAFIVKMYPESANAYDSLAEAYTAEGNIDLAVENYLKAQELDPGNQNTVEMLEKLSGQRSGEQ
jgi:tetratricopeptide (TPR) repeat protein